VTMVVAKGFACSLSRSAQTLKTLAEKIREEKLRKFPFGTAGASRARTQLVRARRALLLEQRSTPRYRDPAPV
jgi:hypothetical protein